MPLRVCRRNANLYMGCSAKKTLSLAHRLTSGSGGASSGGGRSGGAASANASDSAAASAGGSDGAASANASDSASASAGASAVAGDEGPSKSQKKRIRKQIVAMEYEARIRTEPGQNLQPATTGTAQKKKAQLQKKRARQVHLESANSDAMIF